MVDPTDLVPRNLISRRTPRGTPPYLRGPMSLLAKFARNDPPGLLVPVLLGLEFFLAHRADFQLFLPPRDGRILFP